MSEEIPFCERGVKKWVTALVTLGLGVLGFAVWTAVADHKGPKFGRTRTRGGAGQGVMAAEIGPSVPGRGGARGGAGTPVAMTYPVTTVAAQMPNMATPSPVQQQQIDALTRATPMGGIQFIGGNVPNANNPALKSGFNVAADVIRPSVVNINAIRPAQNDPRVANRVDPRFVDPFDGVPEKIIGQLAYESVGSGVIVDPNGYIITNHHVVSGATSIMVTRFNHIEGNFSARVVASDPGKDLALLKMIGDGPYPAAAMADSSRVEVGDWVLAVGNPFGLEHTVTAGIVSGKRSALNIAGVSYRGLLQTDAPINKGSSGGPLVNLKGEVIGINTAIYAPTGVFNGTGFAIPSNRVGGFAARYLGQQNAVAARLPVAMQRAPSKSNTWLGIGVIDITPDLAAKLSYPNAGGVYVSSLVLDSPADEAEVTRGDIVISVSGQPIQNSEELKFMTRQMQVGQIIPITVWRNGKTINLKLRTTAGKAAGF